MSITVCMLAKDADETIEASLKTAIDIGDEVVVMIDASSSDGTEDIVDQFVRNSRTVLSREYMFTGFGEARNKLIELASSDWIFMLDSDETMEDEATFAIRSAVYRKPPLAIYGFKRHNWIDFERSSYREDHYPDWQYRLFPNDESVTYGAQKVHEMPEGLRYVRFPFESPVTGKFHIEHFCFAVRDGADWHRVNQFYASLNGK